jgi:hypothetical protein
MGGLAGGPATALAASAGGVSAGPLHWDPSNPATRSYYIPTVPPGGTFTDQIRVQNPNDDAVDLYVNAVDGITAIPSGAVYANRTDPVARWGAWLETGISSMTMGAHQDSLVSFTVRVPADATPGDHLAGVAFENAHPTPGSGSISITSIVRTVVGVLVKVPGPAAFHLTISAATIQPLSNANLSSVVVTLTDDGRLLGKPRLTINLRGPNGYSRTVTHQFDTILPGDTIQLPFPWPDNLAPGTYRITITATAAEMAGTVSYTGTADLNAALTGVPPAPDTARPAGPTPPIIISTLPAWAVLMTIGTGILVVVLLVAVVLLIGVARRRRARTASPGP